MILMLQQVIEKKMNYFSHLHHLSFLAFRQTPFHQIYPLEP